MGANSIRMRVEYFGRSVDGDGSKGATFFLNEKPTYLPTAGDKVLVTHTETSTGVQNTLNSLQTNTLIGTFDEFITESSGLTTNDGFIYLMHIIYNDSSISLKTKGTSRGFIEYEANPSNLQVLKSVENVQVVTEKAYFDDIDGNNSLIGTTSGASQNLGQIMPMCFINQSDTTSVFSNLYKTFNLPITNTQQKDFTRSALGNLIAGTSFYVTGELYDWTTAGGISSDSVVHPRTGHTGQFYGTAYQYLNQSKVLVIEIPQNQYGEIIDGKSVKIILPRNTSGATFEIYSAFKKNTTFYNTTGLDKFLSENDLNAGYFNNQPNLDTTLTDYQSNVALLFSDQIKAPGGNTGKTWSDGHTQVMNGERVYSNGVAINKEFFDLYNDQAVGIAYLDKGFFVITDSTIVNAVYNLYTGLTGNTTALNIINNVGDPVSSQFLFPSSGTTGYTTPICEFVSYNTEKSLNVVAIASTDEFYKSTNPTAIELIGDTNNYKYADFKSGDDNLYPIIISSIGLYDSDGTLLAVCKPSEPIKKYWYEVVSFHIKIRL